MRFRKKPVEIEAERYGGGAPHDELVDLLAAGDWAVDIDGIVITTLEGDMVARPGDWIIRGVAGELYPCKPDIFDATYEPVA